MGMRSAGVVDASGLTDEEKEKKPSKVGKAIAAIKGGAATQLLSTSNPTPTVSKGGRADTAAIGRNAVNEGNNAVIQGATTGAKVGGPWGAVVGAAVGILQKSQKIKQANKDITGATIRELGDIRKEEQDKVSNTIGGIINNLRGTFL